MASSLLFRKLFVVLAISGMVIITLMSLRNVAKIVKSTTNPHPSIPSDHNNNVKDHDLKNNVEESVNNPTNPHHHVIYNPTSSIEISKNIKDPELNRTKRLPQALIIGVMKCGTFALKKMMLMHSKIVSSLHDAEMNFFNYHYKKGLDWYREKMPYSYIDQITVEKSPKYTQIVNTDLPLRIKSMNSSIRLILIVKDPVTRTIGHFTHDKARIKDLDTFENMIFRPDGEVNYEHRLIARSLYANFLQLYLEVFSRKQILVVDGDQLILNPVPILNNVEKFLNLETEITKDLFFYNETRGFYCLKKDGEGCLKKQKGRKHPEIDEDILNKLRSFFAPYNKKFYDLVGHDFGWEK